MQPSRHIDPMTFKPSFSSKRSKEMNRLMKMLLALAITGLLAAQPAMAADEHVLDQDAAAALKSLSTLTGQKVVYAFIFDQSGLMAGMGLVGQKISRLK
jgi:hypothetical protein